MYSLLIPQTPRFGDLPQAVVQVEQKQRLYLQLKRSAPEGLVPLRFTTQARWAERDWLEADSWGFWLCTDQVRTLFQEAHVPGHLYPVSLCTRQHGKRVELPRFLFVPARLEGMIDLDRCEYGYSPAGTRALARVVLTPEAEQQHPPLFVGSPTAQLFIHERLRTRMEAAQLTGSAFAPLDTVHNPWAGLELPDLRRRLAQHPTEVSAWVNLIEDLLLLLHPAEAVQALEEAAQYLKPLPAALIDLGKKAQTALAWPSVGSSVALSVRR